VQIGSSSELVIDALEAGADGAARDIVLTQFAGRSEYDVATVVDESSRFLVHPLRVPLRMARLHRARQRVQAALYVTEALSMSGKQASAVDAGR
jgi:hypothetical protein